jgi:hypothetical protein
MNSNTIHQFIDLAEKKLEGDWVLLGGSLLYFFDHDFRVTTDIDFVPLHSKKNNQNLLKTFEIAAELGLPVDTINSAALYFLEKVKDYEKELLVIRKWKTGRVLRPNLYLFFVLKLARFSENDFRDCIEFLKIDLEEKNPESLQRVQEFIRKMMKQTSRNEVEKLEKLTKLERLLKSS